MRWKILFYRLCLDVVLNVKKSALMRIGPRFNADFSPVLLYGTALPLVEKISYLGVDISSGRSLRLCMHTRRMKFFRRSICYMLS